MKVGMKNKSMKCLYEDKDELFAEIKKLAQRSELTRWIEGKSCFVINNFVVKNDLFTFKVKCYRSDYGCYMVNVGAAKITLKGTLSDIKQKIVNSVSQSEFKVVKA
ncbi:hypothetical protein [Bacillus cereus]|uniref:hypothetical protein n=1 Tax=Bacillus cereus TaxID=1396 RepID=UPI000B4B0269|nr:hypothetical protein [Bacillus cereus]